MTSADVRVLARGMGFVEAPVWDPVLGLLVADETVGGIWAVPTAWDAEPTPVVPHRRGVSGLCVHASGRLVLTGRTVAAKAPTPTVEPTLTLVDADDRRRAFGDLTVDPRGQVLVGAFGAVPVSLDLGPDDPPGQLLCIGLDGAVTVVDDDVLLPNGLGFSPDGTRLYAVDSLRRHVTVREARTDGTFGPCDVLVSISDGAPDGMAVAADGSLWVATLEAGIQVFDPRGTRVGGHALDGRVTSLCFAGDDLDVVVATVLDESGADGRVLALSAGVRGVPVGRAAVRLPSA